MISPYMASHQRLDTSLFERLLVRGTRAVVLNVQHRMRPSMVPLISPSIYPGLTSGPGVFLFPHVPGMQKDIFFYDHSEPEGKEGTGYYNRHEAEMSLALANYLVTAHKVPPGTITIIAAYQAQVDLLIRLQKANYPNLPNLKIASLDNYQVSFIFIFLLFKKY